MIQTDRPEMCCGCGVCIQACPKKCITMAQDLYGFLHASVDADNCVHCNACESVCPIQTYERRENRKHTAFAAYANNSETRFSGSSGGMFGLLAKQTLKNGGIVFGAALDKDLQLKCTEANSVSELKPLYKSKYLQSNLHGAFPKIREILERKETVLFTATPCQVRALQLYLGRQYDNLLTVDFVCHGVPPQSLFNRCRTFVEESRGISILDYSFRAKKKHGATPHYFSVTYEKNGRIRKRTMLYTKSPFYLGFQKYITLRDSCYECPFAGSNRCSDITISDFHNIDHYFRGINRFDGVSTVVLNTDKGREAWEEIKSQTTCCPVDFSLLLDNGELMVSPTEMPPRREAFLRDLVNEPFDTVVRRYMNTKAEWKKSIYYKMPKPIRGLLKKVIGL